MKYIKQILKTISWPVIFIAGQFFINYIFTSYFNSVNIIKYKNIFPNYTDLQIINTIKYKTELANYLNNNALLITLLSFIIFIPLFIRWLKKHRINYNLNSKKINYQSIIKIILLGISISLTYNILIYEINLNIHITDSFAVKDISVITLILTSGIMGPILEELLFRGIVYNKLLIFNNKNRSIFITSLIFSLFHFPNIINIIYAFFLSFILIFLFEKYKTLKVPILLHIFINTTIVLFLPIIIAGNILINTFLLIVSIITIFILLLLSKNSR